MPILGLKCNTSISDDKITNKITNYILSSSITGHHLSETIAIILMIQYYYIIKQNKTNFVNIDATIHDVKHQTLYIENSS